MVRELTYNEERRVDAYMDLCDAMIGRGIIDGIELWQVSTPETTAIYDDTNKMIVDIEHILLEMERKWRNEER